jgi:hypothetical protein
MWLRSFSFANFLWSPAANSSSSASDESPRKNKLIVSRGARYFRKLHRNIDFTNILRRAVFLSSLFASFLRSPKSPHLSNRKVCSRNSLYGHSQFAPFPAARESSTNLQEDFVPRSFSSISAAAVDSAHPQLLPILLFCAVAACLVVLLPSIPQLTQTQLAPSPSSLAYRLSPGAPALQAEQPRTFFASPATYFTSISAAAVPAPVTNRVLN